MDLGIIYSNMDLVMKIVYSILVLIAAKFVVILLRPSMRKLDGHIGDVDLSESTHKLIENVIHFGIYMAAVVVILYIFGLKDAFYGILTGGAVFGFAIGYASKDIVSNMLSGIMIAIDKPFRIGDRIMAAGITGVVKDITLRTTEMKTDEGVKVFVPNSKLLEGPVHNYGRKKK